MERDDDAPLSGAEYLGGRLSQDEAASRFAERWPYASSTKIQGFEKVYVPYYEFTYLVTFESGRAPQSGTYHVDAIQLTCRDLPIDSGEPRLVARRGGTQLPEAHTPDEAKIAAREAIMESLPQEIARKGEQFSLTLEHRGRLFVPYWVAYYQGSRLDVYEFLVLDSNTGDVNDGAKEIVDRGFLLLDQKKGTTPPWY